MNETTIHFIGAIAVLLLVFFMPAGNGGGRGQQGGGFGGGFGGQSGGRGGQGGGRRGQGRGNGF